MAHGPGGSIGKFVIHRNRLFKLCLSVSSFNKLHTSQSIRFTLSGALEFLLSQLHTLAALLAEPTLANQALSVQPVVAVLEFAPSCAGLLVVVVAFLARVARVVFAAVDLTGSSLQLVVRNTVDALSSLVAQASGLNLAAVPIRGQVVSAFAVGAAIIIECLAIFNRTVVSNHPEGLEAFLAGVILLLSAASQQQVVATHTKNKRKIGTAFGTDP